MTAWLVARMRQINYKKKNRDAAGIYVRFNASLNSCLLVVVLLIFSEFILRTLFPVYDFAEDKDVGLLGHLFIGDIVPPLLFLIDLLISNNTYGMRNMKIEYCSSIGNKVSRFICLKRILVGILTFPLLPVSLFLSFSDPERKTIADRICKTKVCFVNR